MAPRRYRLEFMVQGYPSASEAIADADVANVVAELEHVVEAFHGCTCRSVRCTERSAHMHMSNGHSLHVDADDRGKVVARVDQLAADCNTQDVIEDYALVWKNCDEVWERGRSLRACIGKRFKNVFYNGNELYVYWDGLDNALCFRPAKDVDTGGIVLYWHLAE